MLKAFRERRVGVSKENIYDPVKVRRDARHQGTAGRGRSPERHRHRRDRRSFRHVARHQLQDRRRRSRARRRDPVRGNTVFSDGQLRGAMKYVKEAGLITRFKSTDIPRPRETRIRPASRRQLHALEGLSPGASRRAARRERGRVGVLVFRFCRCRCSPRLTKACASPFRSWKARSIVSASSK